MLGREHGMIALFVFFIEAPLSPCHSMQNIRGLDCEDVWAVMIRIKRQILNSVIEAFSSIKSNTMGHSCKRNASPGQPSSCLFILGQRSASCFSSFYPFHLLQKLFNSWEVCRYGTTFTALEDKCISRFWNKTTFLICLPITHSLCSILGIIKEISNSFWTFSHQRGNL